MIRGLISAFIKFVAAWPRIIYPKKGGEGGGGRYTSHPYQRGRISQPAAPWVTVHDETVHGAYVTPLIIRPEREGEGGRGKRGRGRERTDIAAKASLVSIETDR